MAGGAGGGDGRGRLVVSDLDGTLTTAEMWRGVIAWLAEVRPSRSARWFARVRLPIIFAVRLGLYDRTTFRAVWMRDLARLLRDLDEAQLTAMGAWVVDRVLWPARRGPALDALAAAVRAAEAEAPGAPVELILASGAYQPIADAFARRAGAGGALGTPLEVRDGRATGRLAAPVGSGEQKAASVRAHAAGREIAAAFGDTVADIPLLELAVRAVAVAPDARLRDTAAQRGWEILEAD
jgi:HAD superfamily phosphoserine phosphatase-like hydrolase